MNLASVAATNSTLYQPGEIQKQAAAAAQAAPASPAAKTDLPTTQVVPSARQAPQEDLDTMLERGMNNMAASTPVGASSVRYNTRLPDLYRFDNQYLYTAAGKTYARIDADSDGVWDRAELTAYADAYNKATGRTLDVDQLLLDYGNASGVIDYSGQTRMYNDDVLGITYVQDDLLRAEMGYGTSGGSRPRINDKYFDDFVSKYTYGTANKLYAKIDQNEDGVWTLDELQEYTKAYERATGIRLDAQTLFAKYDRDGSGYLTYTEMNEMYKDDALGLSVIGDAMKARDNKYSGGDDKAPGETASGNRDRLFNTLTDMWGSKFSSSELRSLASTFSSSMQKAALLDAFMYSNNMITGVNSWNRFYGNTNTYWMAGNISMLNMFL